MFFEWAFVGSGAPLTLQRIQPSFCHQANGVLPRNLPFVGRKSALSQKGLRITMLFGFTLLYSTICCASNVPMYRLHRVKWMIFVFMEAEQCSPNRSIQFNVKHRRAKFMLVVSMLYNFCCVNSLRPPPCTLWTFGISREGDMSSTRFWGRESSRKEVFSN